MFLYNSKLTCLNIIAVMLLKNSINIHNNKDYKTQDYHNNLTNLLNLLREIVLKINFKEKMPIIDYH